MQKRGKLVYFSLGREDWGVCLPIASANRVGEGRTGIISSVLGFDNIDNARDERLLLPKIYFYLSKKLKAAVRVLSGA